MKLFYSQKAMNSVLGKPKGSCLLQGNTLRVYYTYQIESGSSLGFVDVRGVISRPLSNLIMSFPALMLVLITLRLIPLYLDFDPKYQ